ncbi:hypothetical protein COU37_05160 [Candidatus Micrarchaeota archaeon CG10_big_fil_rev_8_21_14_0_10_45_29]|nr:MAG: hypothetical protein COU37_05160 [Candidatus Micrarchaeota archaeon CG10_big_fil_rev_8_21_14_0_10_45_29]
MKINWARIAGNFGVGFFSAYMAVSFVDGEIDKKLLIAILVGIGQGGLAASKDLLAQSEHEAKKGQSGPLLSVF